MSVPFVKMHGLGNDFVVIDARARPLALSVQAARAIADRRRGVGCDQIIVLLPPEDGAADAVMHIRNPDGSEAGACGNATRCIAALLMHERGAGRVRIATAGGLLDCTAAEDAVTVDMGPARLDWRDIPLAEPCDTLHLPVAAGPLSDPAGVSMGNPHAVFFVPDAAAVPLAELGPRLEHHPLFPQRANIEVCQVLDGGRLRMRVWERGAGITPACGSGACAAAVAAHHRGLTGRRVEVVLDGGTLVIELRGDGRVLMTGPVATSFRGILDDTLLTGITAGMTA